MPFQRVTSRARFTVKRATAPGFRVRLGDQIALLGLSEFRVLGAVKNLFLGIHPHHGAGPRIFRRRRRSRFSWVFSRALRLLAAPGAGCEAQQQRHSGDRRAVAIRTRCGRMRIHNVISRRLVLR